MLYRDYCGRGGGKGKFIKQEQLEHWKGCDVGNLDPRKLFLSLYLRVPKAMVYIKEESFLSSTREKDSDSHQIALHSRQVRERKKQKQKKHNTFT